MASDFVVCEYMEQVSDRIRQGIPVCLREAIAAIEYQKQRREYERERVWWRRAMKAIRTAWNRRNTGGERG